MPLVPEDCPVVSIAPPHAVREAPTSAPLAASDERNLRRSWVVRMPRDKQGACAARVHVTPRASAANAVEARANLSRTPTWLTVSARGTGMGRGP